VTSTRERVLFSRRHWIFLLGAAAVAACASTPKPIQTQVSDGPPVEVATAEGMVRGVSEGEVHVFKGIPYAAPVDGLNRWLPPRPAAKREGVFDASHYGPACEQTVASMPRWMLSEAGEISTIEMGGMELHAAEDKSPDCLRMNIWTPSLPDPSAPIQAEINGLPVMVMLHGGGLAMASASSKAQVGTVLAQKGAVVVGINYRLGAIGFLAGDGLFEGELLKGNRGFMDSVRALEWIRDNIANFGGDPANVTLMGQSGGGTNVWGVLASPASKGLVHRAIVMSGPINHVSVEDHKKLTETVLKKWGVPVGDAAALAEVKTKDATSTVTTTSLVGSDAFGELSRMYLPNTGAYGTEFLPDDVFTAIQKGRLNNIDLLIGNCNDDAKASIAAVPIPDSMAIDIWNGYIGGMIAKTKEGEEEMAKKYIAAMPGVDETRAKEHLQTDAYQFNWESPAADGKIGAMHGLDLIFAFGNLGNYPLALGSEGGKITPATQRLSDQMSDAWLNFARTGTPSSEKLPEWPEYEPGARKTMVFDKQSAVVSDPQGELRKLWE